MMKKTLPTYRAFVVFVFVASVAGDEDFLGDDETSLFLSLKSKCPEYFDHFTCIYWSSLKDEFNSDRPSRDVTSDTPEGYLLNLSMARPEKRFTVFRRYNPVAQGYKRGPGFRSWGGKRDSASLTQNQDKRTKFASWGGKRDGEYPSGESSSSNFLDSEKRTKFVSWGGKRGEMEAAPMDQEKRSKFRSWGGKRLTHDFMEEMEKRDAEAPISYDQVEKRGLWNYRALYPSESFKKHLPKRPQFQSWGGKRTLYPWNDLLRLNSQGYDLKNLLYTGEKRKFSSWGGKRSDDAENPTEGDLAKRHSFRNWGGKRTPDEGWLQEEIKPKLPSQTDVSQRNRRQAANTNPETVESNFGFNSWGGKRGDERNGR